jgi:hypothetical protein
MSRRCQGGCNRTLDEYYDLGNDTIYCYDCWRRAIDHIESVNRDNYLLYQEDLRIHREKEIQLKNLDDEISNKVSSPEYQRYLNSDGGLMFHDQRPANYEEVETLRSKRRNLQGDVFRQPKPRYPVSAGHLKNPRFHSREMVKREEEEERKRWEQQRKENERKQKEYELKTIADAQALFETVKQQSFTPEIIEDVKRKIAIIMRLLKKKSFQDSQTALLQMKEEYEWQLGKNDKYKSALFNITETRHEFIKKRKAAKKKAQELFVKLMQNKPVNNSEEVKIKIDEIEKLLSNDTYNDYVTAISLLEKEYEWQFNEKEQFNSTLFDIDTVREKYETERNNTINEARALFDTLFSAIKMNEQTEIRKNEIESILNNETYNDAKEAIQLLNRNYSWRTKKGNSFEATLTTLNEELAKCKKKEKEQEEKEIQKKNEEFEKEQQLQANIAAYEAKKEFWGWVRAAIIVGFVFFIIKSCFL